MAGPPPPRRFSESCRPRGLPETTRPSPSARENNEGVNVDGGGEGRLGEPFPCKEISCVLGPQGTDRHLRRGPAQGGRISRLINISLRVSGKERPPRFTQAINQHPTAQTGLGDRQPILPGDPTPTPTPQAAGPAPASSQAARGQCGPLRPPDSPQPPRRGDSVGLNDPGRILTLILVPIEFWLKLLNKTNRMLKLDCPSIHAHQGRKRDFWEGSEF